jgi:hypothetical protein
MEEFRKLNIDPPGRPVTNQHPFLVAGVCFAFVILLLAAIAFFKHREGSVSPRQQKENSLKNR